MVSLPGSPNMAVPGIFRGHTLSTPLGYLPPAKQTAILEYIQANASRTTAHEVRLVLENRIAIGDLSKAALAEMRRLAVQFLLG